ncbi:hypothetical protein GOV04_04860 [Candidatus Woesearchaeota archaeon]|nr:hypothetical protein [Candidatus Woesearchaeota archaeon]
MASEESIEDKVGINIIPVIYHLQGLAEDIQAIKDAGLDNIQGHFVKIPKDFPADYIDVARSAVLFLYNPQNSTNPIHDIADRQMVRRAYMHLKTGKTELFPIAESYKTTEKKLGISIVEDQP